MSRLVEFRMLAMAVLALAGCSTSQVGDNTASRLRQWRKGVWISGEGTYTIYIDKHYFVVSFEGDTLDPNIYAGASQIAFHAKGIARSQTVRIRRAPGQDISQGRWTSFTPEPGESPLFFDSALFQPGACTIKDGVIYDAVTEVTDTSILLSTCNGDREIIYSDGRSAYLPVSGGEYYSYRIEELKD